ncbi:3299_t:CDS:1, partial [Racocetra persica]
MTTIIGKINLINNLLGIVDIKLKFISANTANIGNELRIVNTPPSDGETRKIPFEQDANATAVKEIEIRVRPVLNDIINSLEYRTYTAMFEKNINFYDDIKLNIIVGDKDTHSDKVTLEVENIKYTAELVSVEKYVLGLDINQNQSKKNIGTEKNVGCPMANNFTFVHKTDNDSIMPQEVGNGNSDNWFFRFLHGQDSEKFPLTQEGTPEDWKLARHNLTKRKRLILGHVA